ncbi:uncharacterized protein N7511_006851 [Penicillium nucicola]|uniref:uncharacterized protein n=1 Tax=Penicillium nucicola TaxID=1850975 RepID=UPI002545A0A8|nr:uncharacterized protein N7511_006851 [Penicillium nucicola]KAJ5758157.1 hypothetical protein N7511_006851 [Penicillium nucicola]
MDPDTDDQQEAGKWTSKQGFRFAAFQKESFRNPSARLGILIAPPNWWEWWELGIVVSVDVLVEKGLVKILFSVNC